MVYNISNTHIFDYVGKKGIIIRADVLSPDDYLPSVLIGRDIQIQELASLMKPLFILGRLIMLLFLVRLVVGRRQLRNMF